MRVRFAGLNVQQSALGESLATHSDEGPMEVNNEIAFEMATSNLRFGVGVTREVGVDLVDLGVRRALVVTDSQLSRLTPVRTVLESLEAAGVTSVLFDKVRVEPTDESFREAIHFA